MPSRAVICWCRCMLRRTSTANQEVPPTLAPGLGAGPRLSLSGFSVFTSNHSIIPPVIVQSTIHIHPLLKSSSSGPLFPSFFLHHTPISLSLQTLPFSLSSLRPSPPDLSLSSHNPDSPITHLSPFHATSRPPLSHLNPPPHRRQSFCGVAQRQPRHLNRRDAKFPPLLAVSLRARGCRETISPHLSQLSPHSKHFLEIHTSNIIQVRCSRPLRTCSASG